MIKPEAEIVLNANQNFEMMELIQDHQISSGEYNRSRDLNRSENSEPDDQKFELTDVEYDPLRKLALTTYSRIQDIHWKAKNGKLKDEEIEFVCSKLLGPKLYIIPSHAVKTDALIIEILFSVVEKLTDFSPRILAIINNKLSFFRYNPPEVIKKRLTVLFHQPEDSDIEKIKYFAEQASQTLNLILNPEAKAIIKEEEKKNF